MLGEQPVDQPPIHSTAGVSVEGLEVHAAVVRVVEPAAAWARDKVVEDLD